jgi:hypothetical protein
MKYATKNYIGKNKNSRKTKAKTTAPTVGRICRLDETDKNASEIRKDKRKSVPINQLPMVF